MFEISKKYGPGVQYVSSDTPLDDIISLIKRDGGVVVKRLIPPELVDKAHEEIRGRLDEDKPWDGDFFPSTDSPVTFLSF